MVKNNYYDDGLTTDYPPSKSHFKTKQSPHETKKEADSINKIKKQALPISLLDSSF
ncbi:hypothetical protein IKF28_00150 [Candidatus Saccharibacteria bacterium]|nr:hypothetical protein [Candidatus Saccharibacteria bacterium]